MKKYHGQVIDARIGGVDVRISVGPWRAEIRDQAA
jgi:hypothetical protein